MSNRRFWVVFVLALFAFLLPVAQASAAPALKASVKAGADGKVKYGRGAPITIEIENTGTAFSGDLVIDIQHTYEAGIGEVYPVDIGAGETKTISFIIPKMYDFNHYGMNNKSIYFYEGGWKKGKEIEHKGAQQITASMYHDDTNILLGFTNNIDRLSPIKGIRTANSFNTLLIDSDKLTNYPEEAAGYGPADYILIDEFPVADMSAAEMKALMGWVEAGGVIIFGASDHIDAESGIFTEYLPLQLGERTEISAAQLNAVSDSEKIDANLPAYQATLKEGAKTIFSPETGIFAAYKDVGSGKVVQLNFSIGDEPMPKMTDAVQLWRKIFEALESQKYSSSGNYYGDPLESVSWTIASPNELFESFKVSAPLLFGIILIYVLLIVPALYFILKKKDKREHAWWIIPAISLTVSALIFGYGAKDRIGKSQIQQSAVMEVGNTGKLTGYFAESILTDKSGTVTFTASKEAVLSYSQPYSYNMFFGGGPTGAAMHKKALIEKDASSSILHLRDIGYWDVATVFGQATSDIEGGFDIQLTIKNKVMTGEITNNFPFGIKEAAIWSGNNLIPLGDLGPNETLQVDQQLKTSNLVQKTSINPYGGMGMPPSSSDDLMKMRKDGLMQFSGEFMSSERAPALVGYTDTPLVPLTVENRKTSLSALTLITQSFRPKVEFTGKFTVDPEMMDMTLLSEQNNMEAYDSGMQNNSYYFDEQVYIQTWQLPDELRDKKFNYKTIDVSKVQSSAYNVSIFNAKTDSYEELENEKKLKIPIEPAGDYIAEDGTVKLRLEFHNKNGNEAIAPIVRLNGEVSP